MLIQISFHPVYFLLYLGQVVIALHVVIQKSPAAITTIFITTPSPGIALVREAIALEMLEKVRIPYASNVMRQHPHQLSGGQRQRVMIAMALMCEPQLLIADEPTTALDVTVQSEILDLMDELKRETGTAMVLITHDMGVVARLADKVQVMNKGLYVETGDVHQIFSGTFCGPFHPAVLL